MAETTGRQEHFTFRISRQAKIGLGITVILVIVVLGGFYVSLANTKNNVDVLQSLITPSPEVESGEALRTLRATEEAALTTYGWVDRPNGIVHIPIDRAMDLILQRGLPTRPENQQPKP